MAPIIAARVLPRAARSPAAIASSGVAPRAIALATASVRCYSIFLRRLFLNQLQKDMSAICPSADRTKPVRDRGKATPRHMSP
ncbi:hypothetical protein [Micromonospora sediminimaris]|nr:hypothetical protein [Micromonospora sediminimaris]SFD41475.1 hypothetical protein SAMN05216284_116117 [Micromonospora sediminimaris]